MSIHALKSYACHSDQSNGRQFDESLDPFNNAFELDRKRVAGCAAFRRLEYKTQAFVTLEDDHFRTRLTHTLEVAGIARVLAKALGVNETLAETISLAHDLGHPPFGHAGEVALRELMAENGGFEHNTHALRVVDYLEHPFPQHRGLNLTFETREGLIKHSTKYDRPEGASKDPSLWDLFECGNLPSMEGQVACVADRLAYDGHDLEDAIAANLVNEDDLASVDIWAEAMEPIREQYPDHVLAAIRRPVLDRLGNLLIADVVEETGKRIAANDPKLVDDLRLMKDGVVALSDSRNKQLNELELFLVEHVYHHHRLVRMDAKARRFIERLFHAYVENSAMLPPRFTQRIDEQGVHRVVCDYIAGMTDRFCQDDYLRMFEPFERV